MNSFQEIFHINSVFEPKLNSNAMVLMADAATLAKFHTNLKRDGISLDNAMIGAGAYGLIFKTRKSADHVIIPGAISRIEYMGMPLDHPIVIKPAFKKSYLDDQYQLLIVPNAPDIAARPVNEEDIKRTIRVLKASGKSQHLVDLSPNNFAFLQDARGELLRYPAEASDPAYRNQPIAYVRDLNACLADEKTAAAVGGGYNAERFYREFGIGFADVLPAPPECVKACEQQYALVDALREDLIKSGIRENSFRSRIFRLPQTRGVA